MAEAIRMPLLSDTMTEGVIAEWHKKVGDKVKSDDVLAEVETDKATMEVTPYVEGTLLYIGVEKGQAAKVNDIIAIIGKEGEDYQSILGGEGNKPAEGKRDEAVPQAENKNEEPKPKEDAKPADKQPEPQQKTQKKPKSGDATVIRMPLLSDTMKEGKIASWNKKVGDKIKSDDVLAEVETDKATMEVTPYVEGTLLYIGIEEGQSAKVNDIIAIVGKEGTDVQPYLDEEGGEEAASQPEAAQQPAKEKPEPEQSAETEQQPETEETDTGNGERLKASPLAKKLAKEKGIDIGRVKGSGDNGRIIKRDVESYEPPKQVEKEKPAVAATSQPAVYGGGEGYEDIPLSQMRRVIAQRLAESKFSAPHFYLRMSVTMDKAIEARKSMNDVSPVKISFNDLIIKAAAMTLRKHPEVNSSWKSDAIRRQKHIHIGTAVAIDEGLIVPVIKFADQKSLSQIAEESNVLIEKAKTKKLQPPEFTGNTFTISNLGMMDIDEFTAIINPPDSCILAVGKITPTPVVENNQVVVRQILKLTLSCDHRAVDGAVGARFLQTLKAHLENPVTMLV